LKDNRAVGNSRLVHRDVLNVSCKQVPEPSPGTAHFANKVRSYIMPATLLEFTACPEIQQIWVEFGILPNY
jgi:hypothetical protein